MARIVPISDADREIGESTISCFPCRCTDADPCVDHCEAVSRAYRASLPTEDEFDAFERGLIAMQAWPGGDAA